MCGKIGWWWVEICIFNFYFTKFFHGFHSIFKTNGSSTCIVINIDRKFYLSLIDLIFRCRTKKSRLAAFKVLIELSRDCLDNYDILTRELIGLHRTLAADLFKEYEVWACFVENFNLKTFSCKKLFFEIYIIIIRTYRCYDVMNWKRWHPERRMRSNFLI